MSEPRYHIARIGHEFWAVATPHGAAEEILRGGDAEQRAQELARDRNAELDDDTDPHQLS
ncbi:hypothetical protein [Amycolatopsis sp. TNS106]|uniref:hypothetical protein n=1 Tax=Amycolatopsis sp. TNS106 TaxID=2861750 RepID=UPI001C55C047|nr:hypothetical protein [Amycolatopsis sp. TNS106]